MSLNNNYLIQKSNPLLQELRKSKLNMADLKLIEVYLSKINSHNKDSREVTFSKTDLQEIYGKNIFTSHIEKSLDNIQNLKVSKISENGTLSTKETISLFEYSKISYNDNGTQDIKLKCSESAMKYIFELESLGYLQYKLKNIVYLRSRYSYQLFLYLIQNKFKSTWTVSVTELSMLLNSPYDNFYEMNKVVLKPSLKEINEKTSLKFEYTTIRRGADHATKEVVFNILEWGELKNVLSDIEPEIESITENQNEESTVLYDRMQFFSQAFDETFSPLEVQLLVATANPERITQTAYGADIDKFNYLHLWYKRLLVEEQDKQIKNRFRYLLSMLENDKGGEI